jgi:hypothetical protein
MKTRLHLYPHTGPKSKAYIVAEPHALKSLAKAAEAASKSIVGIDSVTFYTSDGHEFELVLVSDIKEEEWQTLEPPYRSSSSMNSLKILQLYNEING